MPSIGLVDALGGSGHGDRAALAQVLQVVERGKAPAARIVVWTIAPCTDRPRGWRRMRKIYCWTSRSTGLDPKQRALMKRCWSA